MDIPNIYGHTTCKKLINISCNCRLVYIVYVLDMEHGTYSPLFVWEVLNMEKKLALHCHIQLFLLLMHITKNLYNIKFCQNVKKEQLCFHFNIHLFSFWWLPWSFEHMNCVLFNSGYGYFQLLLGLVGQNDKETTKRMLTYQK